MGLILTLTGNLLAEWTFELPHLQPGTTHRATAQSFQLGGKGINVARMLQRFHAPCQCLGFAEGPMADFCSQWLEQHRIPHRWFPLGSGVRPGLVLRQTGSASLPETTFLGTDCPVPADSWSAACRYAAQLQPDWLAVCGSIPGWQSHWLEPLRALLRESPATRLAVDTYGPPLADLVQLPAELVKINRSEWQQLAGYDVASPPPDFPSALHRFAASSPVRNWIITDGAQQILARWQEGSQNLIVPAQIEEVSPTGSGDVFLAALLHHWPVSEAQRPPALATAAACASANAASPRIADFPVPPPHRFRPQAIHSG